MLTGTTERAWRARRRGACAEGVPRPSRRGDEGCDGGCDDRLFLADVRRFAVRTCNRLARDHAPAQDRRGDDPRRHEPHHAPAGSRMSISLPPRTVSQDD